MGQPVLAHSVAPELACCSVAPSGVPRVFSSSDPLVADAANAIERAYPGHLVDVNVLVRRADGSDLTDFDIELPNAVVQVKSGRGNGAGAQVTRTIEGAGGGP